MDHQTSVFDDTSMGYEAGNVLQLTGTDTEKRIDSNDTKTIKHHMSFH